MGTTHHCSVLADIRETRSPMSRHAPRNAAYSEAPLETGPLATSWHLRKFLNPIRDGRRAAGAPDDDYKINNPTLLARIPREELCRAAPRRWMEPLLRPRR